MDVLERQFARLAETYPEARLARRPDGSALVTIPKHPLPTGWSTSTTTVYFVVPLGYPTARPDCFWTEASLRLASGIMPANAQHNANHGGPEQLLWFSYHPSFWDPLNDDLTTYARIIGLRLTEVR